jgi:hypothetical protein
MMKTIIYVAAALLVLQIGLIVIVHKQSMVNLESTAPNTAFLSFDPEQITSVAITGPEDKNLVLDKTDKGWIMPGAFSAPADSAQIKELLRKLADAEQGLAVATSKGAATRFKTAEDDFERHLVLKQGDTVAADFYLGTSAGFRNSHARVASQDAVVSIPVSDFDAAVDPDNWLDSTLASLTKNALKAVKVGDISLIKKDKEWLLDDDLHEATKAEEVDKLLDKVTGISVEAVLDPEKSAALFKEEPAARFTVTKKDDTEVTYTFAAQDEHYVLKMSDSELYFKIGKWQVEGLADIKRDKLSIGYTEEKAEEPTEVPELPQELPQKDTPEQTAGEDAEHKAAHKAEQSALPEFLAEEKAAVREVPQEDAPEQEQSAEQEAAPENAARE